ncbi:MAG: ABC transporter permease [Kineosporiaceae bacterium]
MRPRPGVPAPSAASLLAMVRRDVLVARRDVLVLVAQGLLQPLLLLLVFGRVLTDLGFVRDDYATLLLPGLVGLTIALTAVQSSAIPLVVDLSYTREVEDRLLSPVSTATVAIGKVAVGAARALVAGAAMLPLGVLVLGSVPWNPPGLPLLTVTAILGAVACSGLGMVLGTSVPPDRINSVVALVVTPLLFTGSSQYPWRDLDVIPWFQVVTAFNPLTYLSEGLRAAMLPSGDHLPPWLCVAALSGFALALTALGTRGFVRRASG